MQKVTRLFVVVIVVMSTIAFTACGQVASSEKVLDGAVYFEHPKADILGTVKGSSNSYMSAKLICSDEENLRLIMIFDATNFSIDSAKIYNKQDIEINNVPCGKKLEELQRLAVLGRKFDKVEKVQ